MLTKKNKRKIDDDSVINTVRDNTKSDSHFLQCVSDDCRKTCISDFIDATGSHAVHTLTCAVCAGDFPKEKIQEERLSQLKTRNKLLPTRSHSAHVLTDGMLLHRSSTCTRTDINGVIFVNICTHCIALLRKDKTPPLSLANGMWVGDIPVELNVLTLPERILVARHFPAAYIVKLYPKQTGARNWCSNGMQSGLQGNVSTYRLNTNAIADMIDNHLMPPKSSILAATIGVTFVGPKNIPQKTLPGFLRVNRTRVRIALAWLKGNNPLYHDIIISSDRLADLPCDGVPNEIESLVRHLDNTTALTDESEGYVPEDPVIQHGIVLC